MARAFPELAALTEDISAGWVLKLLEKYPTAERIAAAHLASLEKIPYLPAELAAAVHEAAKRSVASLTGEHAEALVREEVAQVRFCQGAERGLRELLVAAFDDLPGSAHTRILTVIGIGRATAAALVAKVVDIDRFATPEDLVGYFGIFPEENSSGVDKRGRPLPAGTLAMSRKGNDLVRAYLWNAARAAIRHNPVVRALYIRLKAKGKRGDVAIGHCMRKLLHQVYAVWKTDKDFDKDYSPPEAGCDTAAPTTTPLSDAEIVPSRSETAVGHKRDSPAKGVVTTATSTVESAPPPVKPEPGASPPGGPGSTSPTCANR